MDTRELFMREALREAEAAASKGEVPVGAVIVREGEIIARGHNLVELEKNPMAHAEMVALRVAEDQMPGKWLTDCDLYVTLEPCSMCAGAMVLARIRKLYIGTMDPKNGACGSIFNVAQEDRLNHRIEMESGILQEECAAVLTGFFREMRAVRLRRKLERQNNEF